MQVLNCVILFASYPVLITPCFNIDLSACVSVCLTVCQQFVELFISL